MNRIKFLKSEFRIRCDVCDQFKGTCDCGECVKFTLLYIENGEPVREAVDIRMDNGFVCGEKTVVTFGGGGGGVSYVYGSDNHVYMGTVRI